MSPSNVFIEEAFNECQCRSGAGTALFTLVPLLSSNGCCFLLAVCFLSAGVLAWGSSGSLCSLPTLSLLPFALLVSILQSKRITLDAGGFALRVEALNGGLLHFLLACLAHLSHADKSSSAAMLSAAASDKEVLSANPSAEVTAAAALAPAGAVPVLADPVGAPGMSKTSFDGKLYWAKGTGFGTGSTHSTWDVNQAVSRQKKEESHVTALLEVLYRLDVFKADMFHNGHVVCLFRACTCCIWRVCVVFFGVCWVPCASCRQLQIGVLVNQGILSLETVAVHVHEFRMGHVCIGKFWDVQAQLAILCVYFGL